MHILFVEQRNMRSNGIGKRISSSAHTDVYTHIAVNRIHFSRELLSPVIVFTLYSRLREKQVASSFEPRPYSNAVLHFFLVPSGGLVERARASLRSVGIEIRRFKFQTLT